MARYGRRRGRPPRGSAVTLRALRCRLPTRRSGEAARPLGMATVPAPSARVTHSDARSMRSRVASF